MLVAVIMASRPADREPSAAGPAARADRPSRGLRVGRTEVVFTWDGDRWRHAVRIDGRRIASSVEDTADGREPAWPASPPLVEVSTASGPEGTALLAVGAAGRSHFAASFSPDPAEPDTVLVEVACRIAGPAGWLGSTYETGGGLLRIPADPPAGRPPVTVRWAYAAGPAGLRSVPPTRPPAAG